MESKSLRFPIEGIGLDEQPHPYPVEECVGCSQHKSINNVADQRTEQRRTLIGRPIDGLAANKRENREWAKKPPENPESHAPAHTRAIAANVPLKEDAKNCADEQRHQEM